MERRRPARSRLLWLSLAVLCMAGCQRSLQGTSCPCADGFLCCESEDRCYEPGAACLLEESPDGGAGEQQPTAPLMPRHCNQDGFCGARYPFSAVWGSAADDVWATAQDPDAGEPPALLRWNGTRWQNVPNFFLIDSYRIRAISGSSADHVWFVGTDGEAALAFRWGEDAWHSMWFVTEASEFRAVWAPAADDVWAVGAHGDTGHWNGTEWLKRPAATEADLNALWGASATDAWAAGSGGTLLHYDGNGWTPLASDLLPTRADLHALWGRSTDDVWAAGADATVLHFDGEVWSVVEHGLSLEDTTLTALSGTAQTLWAASSDGRLLDFDGSDWSEAPTRARAALRGLWSAASGEVWAVGDAAESLHWDGSRFQQSPAPLQGDLFDVWGSAATDLWAVGSSGRIWHGDGATFTSVAAPESADLFAVHGSSAHDVWAVGSQLLHYEGEAWQLVDESEDVLRDVIAFSPQAAWAVGDGGLILRWDGSTWSESARFPELALASVWGAADDDVWALDAKDGVVRWDGERWETYLTPGGALTDIPTAQVMTGSAVDDMWLVSTHDNDDGTWFDRNLWKGQTFQTYESLDWWGTIRAGWPAGRRDFWLVGQAVWHFTSGEPGYVYRSLDVLLHGVWASEDDVWTVGTEGTILHREPNVEAGYGP